MADPRESPAGGEAAVGMERGCFRRRTAKIPHNAQGALNLCVTGHSEGGNVGETGMGCFVCQQTQAWHQRQAATTVITPELLQQNPQAHSCSYFHRSCRTFCYPDPLLLPLNYRVITSVVCAPVRCSPSEGVSTSSTETSDAPHVSSHLFFILTRFIANVTAGLRWSCC